MRKYPPNCILYPVFEDCTFAPVRKTSVEGVELKRIRSLRLPITMPLYQRQSKLGRSFCRLSTNADACFLLMINIKPHERREVVARARIAGEDLFRAVYADPFAELHVVHPKQRQQRRGLLPDTLHGILTASAVTKPRSRRMRS